MIIDTGTQRWVNAYCTTNTHMIDEHLLLLERILVLALSTRTKCYCFFFFQFYFMHRLTKIIVEIFLPSNLLSIERATANAHISMNFVLREGCAALYFTLPFLSSVEWYIWLSYMATFTCTYVCMWFSLFRLSLASGRDLSTSMLPFLNITDGLR